MLDLELIGFKGGKGGGGGDAPIEYDDSLFSTSYAKVLNLLSEGPIKGLVTGDARSIYLNGTPVKNEDGSENYPNVAWDIRLGTQSQSYIPGFPSVENEIQIGQELRDNVPFVRTISNTDVSSARIRFQLPSLVTTDEKNNVVGGHIDYAIDLASNGGPYVEVKKGAFIGKSSGQFERSESINLPQGTGPWNIRVRRLTPNSSSVTTGDITNIASITEVIDAKLRYPNSAVIGLQVAAEQFPGNLPTMGFYVDGLICQIPSNYDPYSREYVGIWDGTFKNDWTNNPVWVARTIIGHNRFGLRDRINYSNFDIWSLYEVAQYCDELVPDGKGGMEPRYTVNTYLQTRQEGYEFFQNMASIFQGMAFVAGGQILFNADMPKSPNGKIYTNADVENGQFEYSGSPTSNRYTAAAVGWNNPARMFQKEVEYVEDSNAIASLGIIQTEFDAFGCTSQGQAQRAGKWALLTSQLETDSVQFVAPLSALRNKVGDVIPILDRNRSGRDQGGRIAAATTTTVKVDRDLTTVNIGDDLRVAMPSGYSEVRTITGIVGRTLSVAPAFSKVPQVEGSWGVENDIVPQLYRIIKIEESDGKYTVTGLEYNPDKHDAIERNIRIEDRPTVDTSALQAAPDKVELSSHWMIDQDIARSTMTVSWAQAPNAIGYEGGWRLENSDWVRFGPVGGTTLDVVDIRSGNYQSFVRAIGPTGARSKPTYSDITLLEGKNTPPSQVVSLTATGLTMAIRLDWAYSSVPDNLKMVEIRASNSNSFAESYPLTMVAYPATSYTLQNLSYWAEIWFWVRLIDKNGLQGPWFPVETGPGVFGRPSQDATLLLEYLEGKIGAGQLSQDLIKEITDEVGDGIEATLIGQLSGDDENAPDNVLWFAGDTEEEQTFVGTVTIASAVNEDDYAKAKEINLMAARVEENSAFIARMDQVIVNEVEAMAQTIVILSATVEDNTARIATEEQVRATQNSAMAQSIVDMSSTVAGLDANLQVTAQTLADLDGAVSSSWQVKTQVRTDGRVVQAGVAVGASVNSSGQSRSEILLMADTIAFLTKLNGQLHSPFIFDVVNDTAILNSAIIGTASIGFAKIANDIQSLNYVANQTGWKLDKNGFFYNNGTGSGGRRVDTSSLTTIFYSNGNTCLRLGIW